MTYHINKKGEPGLCRAEEGGCPFGADAPHFQTKEEAYEALEIANELMVTLSKKSKSRADLEGKNLKKLEDLKDLELDPIDAENYYHELSRDLEDPEKLEELYRTYQARPYWADHYSVHEELIKNRNTPDDIRQEAILQTAAYHLNSISDFSEFTGLYDNYGDSKKTAPVELLEEQRKALVEARERFERTQKATREKHGRPAADDSFASYYLDTINYALNEYRTYDQDAEYDRHEKAKKELRKKELMSRISVPSVGIGIRLSALKKFNAIERDVRMKRNVHQVLVLTRRWLNGEKI